MLFSEFFLFETIDQIFAEVDSFRNTRLNKNKFIDPKTEKPWRPVDRWKQLEAVVSHEVKVNGTNPNQIWVTFSDVSKLGQRMQIKDNKSTPVGVFAFPISLVLKRKGNLPFAEREYMHVFKTKKPHFEVGKEENSPTDNFEKIAKKSGLDLQDKGEAENFRSFRNDFSRISHALENWLVDRYRSLSFIPYSINTKLFEDNPMSADNFYSRLKDFKISDDIKSYLPDERELDKPLKDAILNAEYHVGGGNEEPKFQNVGDDLSAEFTPGFAKHILKNRDHYNLNLVHMAESGKRIPFKWLDQQIYSYENRSLFDKKKVYYLIELDDIKAKIKNYLEDAKEIVEKYKGFSNTPNTGNYGDLPYGKKLKSLADSYGLDYSKAVKGYQDQKTVKNANQFLYRVSQNLAKQYSLKNGGDWRMAWNKFGRQLGISSFADTKDSGHVHAAETTQGVFMDPKDIVLIATIVQRSHSDKNDDASRPGSHLWSSSSKQHLRVAGTQNQRLGTVPTGIKPAMSPSVRYIEGIKKRLSELKSVFYGPINDRDTFNQYGQAIGHMIKLYKTYKTLVAGGKVNTMDWPQENANMKQIISMINGILSNSTDTYVDLLRPKVDMLARLVSGDETRTPVYRDYRRLPPGKV